MDFITILYDNRNKLEDVFFQIEVGPTKTQLGLKAL